MEISVGRPHVVATQRVALTYDEVRIALESSGGRLAQAAGKLHRARSTVREAARRFGPLPVRPG